MQKKISISLKQEKKMSKQKLGTPLDVLLFPLLPHQAKNITNKKEKKNETM